MQKYLGDLILYLASLSAEYRRTMGKEVLHSWAAEVADEITNFRTKLEPGSGLGIAAEYRRTMDKEVLHSWAADAVAEMTRLMRVMENLSDAPGSGSGDVAETDALQGDQDPTKLSIS